MRGAAAWALAALRRHQLRPGLAPFVLWVHAAGAGAARIREAGLPGVGLAHDVVREREPLVAFAYLARGVVRAADFSFDPAFARQPGARAATVVVAGVHGHPFALVVGQPDGHAQPSFFQQVPNWLGKGPRRSTVAPPAPLAVGVRLKSSQEE